MITIAEKYLKPDMKVAMWKDYNETGQCKSIWQWLDQEAKPTLTEDERVILKNIQPRPTRITRDTDGDFELRYEVNNGIRYDTLPEYNHLFQFIKNGEEYSIKELLEDE